MHEEAVSRHWILHPLAEKWVTPYHEANIPRPDHVSSDANVNLVS